MESSSNCTRRVAVEQDLSPNFHCLKNIVDSINRQKTMPNSIEIWNLSALCRCCHTDGHFKSLSAPCFNGTDVEIYSEMLRDTVNVEIMQPPFEASYTICEECIVRLRDVAQFKTQVLMCERKFEEYCKNELASRANIEAIKYEIDSIDGTDNQADLELNENIEINRSFQIEIEYENAGMKIENSGYDEQEFVNVFGSSVVKNEDDLNKSKIKLVNTEILENATSRVVKPKPIRRKPTARYDYTLEVHVKTDTGTLYSCKACGGSYNDHKFLRRHIMSKHLVGDPFACDQCGLTFRTTVSLNKHKTSHDEKFKCHFCPRILTTAASLKDHLNSHTRDNLFKCDLCAKEFLYKSTLRNHLKDHYGTRRRFMCDLCGHAFNDTTNMRIHIRTVHEKLRPFICDICQKTFAAKKHLVLHVRKHTGDKPFECESCQKKFYTNFHRNNHKCGDNDTKYKCKVCCKVFNDRGTFSQHVRRSHSGERPYQCVVCHKDFTCKYSMKRHELTHSGIKPHSCNICHLKFTQKTMLNRHLVRLHDVPLKSSLNSQKRQTQCPICKRVVVDLNSHKTKCHAVNRATCKVCNKSYSSNTTLNRHIKTVHMGECFKCRYCNKKYGQKNKLTKHQLKVHKVVTKLESEDYDSFNINTNIGEKIENV